MRRSTLSDPQDLRPSGARPSAGESEGPVFRPIDQTDHVLLNVLVSGLPHAVRIYEPGYEQVMANDLGRDSVEHRVFGRDGAWSVLPVTGMQWEQWPVKRAFETHRVATQTYLVERPGETTAFLDMMALPVPGPDGAPRLVVEITRDVTESTVQTAKLKRMEVLLAEMVDQLSGVVASSDSLGDLPRRFEVIDEAGCPHRTGCPLYSPGEARPAECGVTGLEICARCQIAQLAYPDQLQRLTASLDGLLETLHDKHHQLLESQREVIHAERLAAVGELVAGIAHEINNPIGIILSRLDAIELEAETRPLPAGLARDLDVIRAHGKRITRTVESLLAFCRKTPRRLTVTFDLNSVLSDALEFITALCGRRRVTVRADIPAEPMLLRGDPAALQQVFINLFINAADAMGPGGEIRLDLARPDGATPRVEVRVADSGPGIAPENLTRIFDPFFTTKQSTGGTGLGLSVSRRIVEEFGGEISAASEPGRGAVFSVHLPLWQAGSEAA